MVEYKFIFWNSFYLFGILFQDYQVLNLLGKGGFACVYRARSIRTGMEVAIKMVTTISHFKKVLTVELTSLLK